MSEGKKALEEWTRRISDEEMPVFAHTTRSITAASSDEGTPTAELAHLILRDSTMTTRILRLANSVYYNPSAQPVNTISRAIVFLGFNVVRSMALTISILEPLLKGVQHEHVLEEMAKSLHTAVQAKAISQARGNEDAEEIFVASLLNRIGNMAFWCFGGDKTRELDKAYQEWDDKLLAEKETLGFTLRELTFALNEEWNLSTLLKDCLLNPDSEGKQNLDIKNATRMIAAISEGWGSLDTRQAMDAISEHTGLSTTETETLVYNCAHEASKTAIEYGIEAASKLIPLPKAGEHLYKNIDAEAAPKHEPDFALQMSILRELTTMLHDRVEINTILGTISEGIYRALGMERTVIAFVSPKDQKLTAKYILGDDKERLKNCFAFPAGPGDRNLFTDVLREKSPIWLNARTQSQYGNLYTREIKQCLGVLDFFCMPIWIGGLGKGVVYADCKLSGRKLSMEEFQTFTHFAEYATLAFDLAARK